MAVFAALWRILLFIHGIVHVLTVFQSKPATEDQLLPLSRAGEDILRKMLLETKDTTFKSETQQMNLLCKNEATRYLLNTFPESEIRWKHNSKNFVLQPSRMTYKLSSLFIQSLETKDTGVFSCQVDVSATRHYVVAVYVVVVGRTLVHVLPGDSDTLDCNSKQLGLMYKDAVGLWEHNGKSVRNSNMSAINAVHELPIVDAMMAGNWTCNVYVESMHRMWTTATYRVALAPIPPMMTRVRIYVKNNALTSGLMLMGCAFVLVILMNTLMSVLDRKERAKKKEIEKLRQMLGIGPKDEEAALIDDTMPLLDRDRL